MIALFCLLQIWAHDSDSPALLEDSIADRMAASAAEHFYESSSGLSPPDLPSASLTSNSKCPSLSPLDRSLRRADNSIAHSLEAASLQQPPSTKWHLARYLTLKSAQDGTETSDKATRQPDSPSFRSERQQQTDEHQTLSPQQENQPTESPCLHPQQGPVRGQKASILGDVSNLMPTSERVAEKSCKHSPPAVLQAAAPGVGTSRDAHFEDSPWPPVATVPATPAGDSTVCPSGQQDSLGQTDDMLRAWYHRYAVCSATTVRPVLNSYLKISFPCPSGTSIGPTVGASVSEVHPAGLCKASAAPLPYQPRSKRPRCSTTALAAADCTRS